MPSRRVVLAGYATLLVVVSFVLASLLLDQEWLPLQNPPAPLSDQCSAMHDDVTCIQYKPANSAPPIVVVEDALGPTKRRNIVVASMFPHHFDVYMTVVWTLQRVLSYVPGSQVRVFAEPFNYGFQSLVDQLALYHGRRRSSSELVSFLSSEEGRAVDMLVLGTCEVDLRTWHTDLLSVWDARPPSQKFQLVCIVHNVKDTAWQSHITDWARRGAIRLLPIAEHVKVAFRRVFDQHAESTDQALSTAGYENIPIDVHVPVLDLANLPFKDPSRTLSKAVIQGSFDITRRDYPRFLTDLLNSLHEDPAVWGYHPLDGHKSFIPDHRAPSPPFQLALVGGGRTPEIPEQLAYVVTVYHDLDYSDFYKLIAGMDIVIPAFADLISYYEEQASSTVALAVELNVPILVTKRMRRSYGYIDDDRTVVTRPAAMCEVQALKALRTGDVSFFLESDPMDNGHKMAEVHGIEKAGQDMLAKSWKRGRNDVNEFKRELWNRNDAVIERVLRDL